MAPKGRKRKLMPSEAHATTWASAGLSLLAGLKYCAAKMRPAAWA